MGTRIDIQVGQALLGQRVRDLAALNREQRLERERKVRDEAVIKTAADKATGEALRNGQQGTGQLRNGLISGKLTPRQYEERLRAQGRKSGVPEYYTPPKVASTGQAIDEGIGNAWHWRTSRNTDVRYFGETGSAANGCIVEIQDFNKLGSIDGTDWLEWTDTFTGSAPTPPSGPVALPPGLTPADYELVRTVRSIRHNSLTPTTAGATLRMVLPVGPQVMLLVIMRQQVFGFQTFVSSRYRAILVDPPGTESIQVIQYGASLSTNTVTIEKAFVIGKSAVREITLPGGLASKLRTYMPASSASIANVTYQNPDDLAFVPDAYFDGATIGVPTSQPRLTWTTTPPADADWTWTAGAAKSLKLVNNGAIPLLNVQTLGSSAAVFPLLTTGVDWETIDFTAKAIHDRAKTVSPSSNLDSFGALIDFEPGIGASFRDPNNYLYETAQKLTCSAGAKTVSVNLDLGRAARPEGNPAVYAYTDSEGVSRSSQWFCDLAFSYDWAKPAYCRRQLLALGFTPEDLTP
jgi:hypothetical protein